MRPIPGTSEPDSPEPDDNPQLERVEGLVAPLLRFDARHYARFHAAIIATLVLLCLIGQYGSLALGHDVMMGLVRDFDLDEEGNFPTWFSAVMLLLSAALLEFVARIRRGRRAEASRWRLLAYGFVLLSIDEAVGFHERLTLPIEMLKNVPAYWKYSWVVPGAGLMVCVVAFFWRWVNMIPGRTRRLLGIAGVLYAVGSVGFEAVGGIVAIAHGLQHWMYVASYVIEETLEMTGVLVLNYALIDFIQHIDPEQVMALAGAEILPPPRRG